MNTTSAPTTPWTEQIARTLAVVIILAGIYDPVFTVTRSVPPVVALRSTDSVRHAPLLQQVRQRLAAQASVVSGDAPGADAQVVVGSALPPTLATDTTVGFVVTTPTRHGFHVERWGAPAAAPLDARTSLLMRVARDAASAQRTADTASVTLEVREEGALVAAQTIALTAGARTTTVLPYVPTREGTHVLEMRLIDGTDTVHWRHPVHARATQWRVLVYDTRPSWLSTFVRRTLERDDRFVVSSRVVTSRQVSRATAHAAGSLAAVERLGSLPDVLIIGAPDALSVADLAALDRLMVVHGLSVVLLPDHLTGNGTLSGARNGFDALLETGPWRVLPALPSNAPRIVQHVPGLHALMGSAMDSIHLLATAIAVPHQLPADAELVATVSTVSTVSTSTVPGSTSSGSTFATQAPVVWRIARGRGTMLVSTAFDAWRFRDARRSTFDGTWRDLIADAATQRAPRMAFLAPPAGEDMPRSRLLRIDPFSSISGNRPIVWVIGPSDTTVARLLPTNVANTWRATWAPMANRNGANARTPLLLQAMFEGDTAFLPLPADDARLSWTEDRPTEQLTAWAQSRRGRVLPASAIDSLAGLISTAVGERRHTAPWHPMRSGWWIVPLALAFGTEWWLRRRRGSP